MLWLLEFLLIVTAVVSATAAVARARALSAIGQGDTADDPSPARRALAISIATGVVAATGAVLLGWWLVFGSQAEPIAPPIVPEQPSSILPSVNSFWIRAITPSGGTSVVNARVRLFFSQPIDESQQARFVAVATVTAGSLPVAGAWSLVPLQSAVTASGLAAQWAEFVPSAACPKDPTDRCFGVNQSVTVTIANGGLVSRNGAALTCSTDHPCTFSFRTTEAIDATAPTANWVFPSQGMDVNANDQLQVLINAEDREALSHTTLIVNGSIVSVSVAEGTSSSLLRLPWNTIGQTVGSRANIQAVVYDIDNHQIKLPILNILFQQPKTLACTYSWVFTPKFGLPSGSSCRADYDCASGYCVGTICVDGPPIITSIDPSNGIAANFANTYITITGRNFGAIQQDSVVRFGSTPAALGCSRWSNTEVIAQAPPTLPKGVADVSLTTRVGRSNTKPFLVDTTIRPALCQMIPDHGGVKDQVALKGDNLGDTRGDSTVTFVGLRSPSYGSWSNTSASAVVPDGAYTGPVVATVVGNRSNPLTFTMDPMIEYLSPASSPEGAWITIVGKNFGTNQGTVVFEGSSQDSSDDRVAAFPQECFGAYWSDSTVIVVVPSGVKNGLVRLTTAPNTPSGALTTAPEYSGSFTRNTDPVGPGLCRLIPPQGMVGDSVVATGARLGSAQESRGMTLGNRTARVSSWFASAVRWNVPDQAGSSDVVARRAVRYNIKETCRWITFRGFCPWGVKTVYDEALVSSNGLPFRVLTARQTLCTIDRQCPSGRCVNGQCTSVDNGGSCQQDRDCRDGLICDPRIRQCRPPGCTTNAECRDGEICHPQLNMCVSRCQTNSQCSAGLVCSHGVCRPPLCRTNTDCQNGQTCDPATNTCVGGHCTNYRQDADETGIDCGGAACNSCGGGRGRGHCSNGRKDADETGVDCGGADCAVCGGNYCPIDRPLYVSGQCVAARCGDGIKQTDRQEQCDDGNTASGDGCSALCAQEGGPPQLAPLPPTLTAGAGNAHVELSWTTNTASPTISGFRLYRSREPIPQSPATLPATACGPPNNPGPSFCLVEGFPADVRSASDTTAANGTRYYYKILAFNNVGASLLSNQADAIPCPTCTGELPPFAPVLTATAGDASVHLIWVKNSSGTLAKGFVLYRSTGDIRETPDTLPTEDCGTTASPRSTFCRVARMPSPNVADFTDMAVSNSTRYFYRILAFNDAGSSPFSNQADATPAEGPAGRCGDEIIQTARGEECDDGNIASGDGCSRQCRIETDLAPLPPSLTARAGNAVVNLLWVPNPAGSSRSGFKLYRSTQPIAQSPSPLPTEGCGTPASPLSAFCLVSASFSASSTTFADTAVANGTRYYYKILAFNNVGASLLSNQADAIPCPTCTGGIAPLRPTLSAAPRENRKVHLLWAPYPSGPAHTGFKLYRSNAIIPETPATLSTAGCGTAASPATSFCLVSATFPADAREYTDAAVADETRYFYRILAFNADGNSPLSELADARVCPTCGVLGDRPIAPDLSATGGSGQVALVWSPKPQSPSIDGYRLYRSRQDLPLTFANLSQLITCTASTSSSVICIVDNSIAPSARRYTDTAVVNGTTYYYKMVAFNTNGNSPLSNQAHATPGGGVITAPPTITSISPNNGISTAQVQTTVTITGTNFGASQGSSKVYFGTGDSRREASLGCGGWSNTQIVVKTPPTLTGTNLPVTVETSVGEVTSDTAQANQRFTVDNTIHPTLCSIQPSPAAQRQTITLTGENFGDRQQFGTGPISTVRFAAAPEPVILESVRQWSTTSIQFDLPQATSSLQSKEGPVTVRVNGQVSNAITLSMQPFITNLSTAQGPVGTTITIQGGNFGTTAGTVLFEGDPASSTDDREGLLATTCPAQWQDDQIRVEVPTAAVSGLVRVRVLESAPAGAVVTTTTARSRTFTVNTGPLSPVLCSVAPLTGLVGTAVTLSGKYFGTADARSRVKIHFPVAGVADAILPVSDGQWSDGSISTAIPATAPAGRAEIVVERTVTANSRQVCDSITIFGYCIFGSTHEEHDVVPVASNAVDFVVTAPPTITSISPNNGISTAQVQTTVTITGTNFGASQGSSKVYFGTGDSRREASLGCGGWSDTEISVRTPPGFDQGTLLSVIVETAAGTAASSQPDEKFTVNSTVHPTLCSIQPSLAAAGQIITLSGENFGDTQTFRSGSFSTTSSVRFAGLADDTSDDVTTTTVRRWSTTSIELEVPQSTAANPQRVKQGGVKVIISSQESNPVMLSMQPFITELSTAQGPATTTFTIRGGNFGISPGKVWFDEDRNFETDNLEGLITGTVCGGTLWQDDLIRVEVPAAAAIARSEDRDTKPFLVRVQTLATAPGGAAITTNARSQTFTVTKGARPPILCSVIPNEGLAGSSITLAGKFFSATQGSGRVKMRIGAQPEVILNVTAWADESIATRIPPTALAGQARLMVEQTVIANVRRVCTGYTVAGVCIFGDWEDRQDSIPATSNEVEFTVTATGAAPTITSISPNNGISTAQVQTTVTITGTNFGASQGSSKVYFGTGDSRREASLGCGGWSDTEISVRTPPGMTGTKIPVTVETSAGSATSTTDNQKFTVDNTVHPTLCSIRPSVAARGQTITLNGENFGDRQLYLHNGIQTYSTVSYRTGPLSRGSVSELGSWSTQSITLPVPNDAVKGEWFVCAMGQCSNGQTLSMPPFITSLSETRGPSGSVITISGGNFGTTAGSVLFDIDGNLDTTADNITGVLNTNACASLWQDDQIRVEVPSVALEPDSDTGVRSASALVRVVVTVTSPGAVAATTTNDRSRRFTVNTGPLPPALCSVNPEEGPASTTIRLSGKFGADSTGARVKIRISTSQPPVQDLPVATGGWTDAQITTRIPADAQPGLAKIFVERDMRANEREVCTGFMVLGYCVFGDTERVYDTVPTISGTVDFTITGGGGVGGNKPDIAFSDRPPVMEQYPNPTNGAQKMLRFHLKNNGSAPITKNILFTMFIDGVIRRGADGSVQFDERGNMLVDRDKKYRSFTLRCAAPKDAGCPVRDEDPTLAAPIPAGADFVVEGVPSPNLDLNTVHTIRLEADHLIAASREHRMLSGLDDFGGWEDMGYAQSAWSNGMIDEANEANNTFVMVIGGAIQRVDIIVPRSPDQIREVRDTAPTATDAPLLNPEQDTFLCAGRDNCSDDMHSVKQGVQHRYIAQAYIEGNVPITAQYRVEIVPQRQGAFQALTPQQAAEYGGVQRPDYDVLNALPSTNVLQTLRRLATYLVPTESGIAARTVANTVFPGDLFITAVPQSEASVSIRISVEGDGVNTLAGSQASRTVTLIQMICENSWPTPRRSPTTGESSFPYIDNYAYAKSFLSTPYGRAGVRFNVAPEDLDAEVVKGRFQSFSLQYCRDGVGENVASSDQFNCVGERCSDDENPNLPGSQHRFRAEAVDENGNVVTNVQYQWSSSQAVNVANLRQGSIDPSQIDVTAIGNGESVITVTVTDQRSEIDSSRRLTKTARMPVTVQYNLRSSRVEPPAPVASPQFRIAQDSTPAVTPLAGVRIIGLPKLLPELELVSVDLPSDSRRLKQLLFHEEIPPQTCQDNRDCQRGTCNTTTHLCTEKPAIGSTDVIALTAMKNTSEFSAVRWYLEPGNVPNPTATRATRISTDCQQRQLFDSTLPPGEDCVWGIQEGNTRYMTMASVQRASSGADEMMMDTYLLEINANAGSPLVRVYEQLFRSWKFAVNLPSDDLIALKRDVRRTTDLRDFEANLIQYNQQRRSYPQLEAGTYIRGQTYSIWPSWRETLGAQLGVTPPLDSINRFLGCNRPFDPITCWDEAAKQFQCPVTSAPASQDYARDYVYTVFGGNAYLGARFEKWKPDGRWPRTFSSPFTQTVANTCGALNMKLP